MSDVISAKRLLSKKDDLKTSRIEEVSVDTGLEAGEVLLNIERFALTTNNITYAAFGEAMGYWQFFPTHREGWGHMPVWGIATVAKSRADGVETGTRYFGYYPMADYLKVEATKVSDRGFRDGTDYRQELPSAYNYYERCADRESLPPQWEDYRMLLRPLFLTSYMLADFLRDNDFFGAGQVVVSSASSKTAYGSAFCLSGEKGIRLIGLTSAKNREFVERIDCYDETRTYGELANIDPSIPTLYVDFSGDNELRHNIHRHFKSILRHDCYVGSASNLEFLEQSPYSDVKTEFFFAARHIRKRNRELGAEAVDKAMNESQALFIEKVSDSNSPWLKIITTEGLESAADVIAALFKNTAGADEGHIIVL